MSSNFKSKLKELRKELGKTQKEVALFLGIVESAYANYEQGRTQPSLEMLVKIAKYYNVSIDYLLGLED